MFNPLSFFNLKQWPSKYQWLRFFNVLSKKEKYVFAIFLVLAVSSLSFIFASLYNKNTKEAPANGGVLTEGVVGQPRFINPIYANSDTDRDLAQLVYSGLMKYDENMKIVPDLAKSYEEQDGGKTYVFYLKDNIFWQDKTPVTAADVVFTIKAIQNPDYKSPIRANWVGVDVLKVSDSVVKFSISQPYGAFLENLTLKILPVHVWQNISPENSPLDVYNLKPIGSGPYKVKEVIQGQNNRIKSLSLVANPYYFGKYPYIDELNFLFFNNETELARAGKNGDLSGFSMTSFEAIKNKGPWNIYNLALPRYFSVFFNQTKSKVLADSAVRIALSYGTDKNEIANSVLPKDSSPENKIVDSPILSNFYGLPLPSAPYNFDPEKAKTILAQADYKDAGKGFLQKSVNRTPSFQFKSNSQLNSQGTEVKELQKCLAKFSDIYPNGEINGVFGKKTEDAVKKFQEKYADEILKPSGFTQGTGQVSKGTRAKLNIICFDNSPDITPLKFTLATVNQFQLMQVADILKQQWKNIGVDVEVVALPIAQLEQDYIKPRNYDALLFGEVLGAIPDPLPFWHSSQTRDPGLNLAIYSNRDVDNLLEDIRKSSDSSARTDKLNQFQNILQKDAPAIFLYSPDYTYYVAKDVKNVAVNKITDPSKRFVGIEDWFIKTKRVWK